MNAPARIQETPQQLADRLLVEDRERRRQDGYSPLYGHPRAYVTNPLTGSTRAVYANGMSFEIALPCCDHCDKPLDDHGYCAACETRSDSWGVDADWAEVGRSINEAVAAFKGRAA